MVALPPAAPSEAALEAGELRRLARLAIPVAGVQLGTMLKGVVDTVMVGRLSVEALAAGAIANVWLFGTLMVANGVLFGLDPVVAQAHGAGDGRRLGLTLQRGLLLAALLSLPLGLAWLATERVLLATGQEPALAAAAHAYVLVQLPSIPFFLGYSVLRQYLQGRELVRPALWVIAAANVANAGFNWVLIFGKLGFPALGLTGAGIATALTRTATALGLALWIRHFRLHEGAWQPWSREVLDPRALRALLALGVPVAAQMGLEIWAFSGSTLIAGHLGATALAAHTITMNLASLTFMVPLGISQGAAVRVGNLIGAARAAAADRSARVALAAGAAVMALFAMGFVSARGLLPALYSTDAGVLAAAAAILPIAGAFQIFDGTQVVACGVLRGMGRTRPAAIANLVGYWIFALPIGGWLALRGGWGLPGLWWGLCLGLGLVATSLFTHVWRRGPSHAVPV